MPKLNDADEVFKGSVQVDRIYKGDVLIWPNVETWSPWMLVGTGAAAAPAAWFAAGITNYPSAHQQVYWRYSLNTGRIVVKGLAVTSAAFAGGAVVITLNIDPAIIPRRAKGMMSFGMVSTDTAVTWTGGFMRFDLSNNPTYHSDITTILGIASGAWTNFGVSWALGDDR